MHKNILGTYRKLTLKRNNRELKIEDLLLTIYTCSIGMCSTHPSYKYFCIHFLQSKIKMELK
jgi:hypothetical protein